MCSSVLLGAEARLAKTDAMLLLDRRRRDGRDGAGLSVLAARRGSRASALEWPAIFWTALAGGILLKGPLILMFVGLTIVTLAILDRIGGMAVAAAAGLGPDVAAGAGAAVVRRDLLARRRNVLRRLRSAATC